MSQDVNTITITGHLGGDPERRSYNDNQGVEQSIAVFSVACNKRPGRGGVERPADWFNVKVFGAQADACLKFLGKGRQVAVVGRMESNQVEKEGGKITYWDLVASDVKFLGAPTEGGAAQSQGNGGQQAPAPAAAGTGLPF